MVDQRGAVRILDAGALLVAIDRGDVARIDALLAGTDPHDLITGLASIALAAIGRPAGTLAEHLDLWGEAYGDGIDTT